MDTVNLDDMIENPRSGSVNVFDLTSGKGIQNNNNEQDVSQRKVVPIQTGHVDMQNAKPININELLPKREVVNPIESDMMSQLDAAVARECDRITEFHNQIFAKQNEEAEAMEAKREEDIQAAEDDFATNGNSSSISVDSYDEYDNEDGTMTTPIRQRFTPNIDEEDTDKTADIDHAVNTEKDDDRVNILDNMTDEELYADEDEETVDSETDANSPSSQELLDDFKNQVKQKIAPIRKSFDLSKFTIAQKAISAQKVMKLAINVHQNVADWVLPGANRCISMSGLSGPEIMKLNPENTNRNRQNTFKDMYRIIYDHVVDANKPEFEAWLKKTRFIDIQHIYFALYMATFGGSNFINYSCPKCNKVFIKDIDFKDMIEYADDETKTNIQNMLKMDSTSISADTYEAELVQVSDSYVFAIRTPSIWNVIMETASLSDNFLEKYGDLIDVITHIDAAYIIDSENNQLIPVDTKPDPNDVVKTAGRRIKAMYDIISTLSSEEYYALRAATNETDSDAVKISYKIPACTCPECSENIPENYEITPDNMLFIRHQLAAIASI